MIEKLTHISEGLALLITEYKDKPRIQAMLTAYLTQVQELEAVFFDLLEIFTDIDSQTGEQLDLLGRVVGQDREERIDAVYIQWIRARILVNKASGLPNELLRVLAVVVPDASRDYTEAYPASYLIEVFDAFSDDPEAVATILGETEPAGVKGFFLYSTEDDDATFFFSSDDTEEASVTQGWADDAQTIGGVWADVEATQ